MVGPPGTVIVDGTFGRCGRCGCVVPVPGGWFRGGLAGGGAAVGVVPGSTVVVVVVVGSVVVVVVVVEVVSVVVADVDVLVGAGVVLLPPPISWLTP